MKIGFAGYARMEGERFEAPPPKNLRVDVRMNVSSYERVREGAYRVKFSCIIQYGGLGMLRLEGHLLVEEVEDKAAKEWEKKRAIPQEVMAQIHATMARICLPDAVILSKFLNLPPPIPIPTPAPVKRKEERSWEVGFA